MISDTPAVTCLPITHQKGSKVPKTHGSKKKASYIYAPHSSDELDRVFNLGGFPSRPSNLFLRMFSDVLKSVDNNKGANANIASHELIATSGVIPLTINAPYDTLFMHYRDAILHAEKEILIAAGFWRKGKVVDIISGALRELNNIISLRGGPKVVVKILWGRGALRYRRKNTERERTKLNIPTPSEVPNLDIESMNVHKAILGVFHVKFMIVDKKFMFLTSANMQDRKNVEFMVHMEGKVVDSFYDVFKKQWHKEFCPPLPLMNESAPTRSDINVTHDPLRGPSIFHSEHGALPMFLANRLPGPSMVRNTWDAPQNIAWLSAMHNAQRSIFIETPDFNASQAIDGILSACTRGVAVTISVSWTYNALKEKYLLQGGNNVHVMKKLYKKLAKVGCQKNLTVCFYVERNQVNPTKLHRNHTKFMAVDDEVAIFGSGNMDTQSWHHSQEVNIVVASPLLVKEWMDLFKISQNTHLFGAIDPSLPTTPKEQIKKLLAKQNTIPKNTTPTSPTILNNNEAVIKSSETYMIDGKHCNNFNTYYNTMRGLENESNNNNNNNTILNSDFFNNPSVLPPSSPVLDAPPMPPASFPSVSEEESDSDIEIGGDKREGEFNASSPFQPAR